MSVKECDHHKGKKRRTFQRVFWCIVVFLFLVLLAILLIWAILRPTKPTFTLQDVTVYAFNATVPNFLTSSFQVTLISRNPNDHIGVYYDRLETYVTYQSQQVTFRTSIPPTYQGHKEVNVWSPFVYGTNVPVAPFNFQGLSQNQAAGTVLITVRANGRVRWKVGTFISGRYHLYVRCPAFISFGARGNGIVVGENAIKFQIIQRCSVSV
ncbi:NDR1/HIN1-like protein 1 [Vigna radiata var. radiata]|uniref:NDR1/HIN1-like protein 1 n=1 Tax=Vigna radiata var. radiata TaxID=3916 RepID=A0A1S3V8Z5_VIGRR|nr:NDR1/HIN1-like protein 1 [Vigna radiata var. radiata]